MAIVLKQVGFSEYPVGTGKPLLSSSATLGGIGEIPVIAGFLAFKYPIPTMLAQGLVSGLLSWKWHPVAGVVAGIPLTAGASFAAVYGWAASGGDVEKWRIFLPPLACVAGTALGTYIGYRYRRKGK